MNLFLPKLKVVHSLSGRVRVHIPMNTMIPQPVQLLLEQFGDYLRHDTGILKFSYNRHSGNALIKYNIAMRTEHEVLEALNRLLGLCVKPGLRILRYNQARRIDAINALQNWLEENPLDVFNPEAGRIPHEIWP